MIPKQRIIGQSLPNIQGMYTECGHLWLKPHSWIVLRAACTNAHVAHRLYLWLQWCNNALILHDSVCLYDSVCFSLWYVICVEWIIIMWANSRMDLSKRIKREWWGGGWGTKQPFRANIIESATNLRLQRSSNWLISFGHHATNSDHSSLPCLDLLAPYYKHHVSFAWCSALSLTCVVACSAA